jgi:hypothetical protein
VYGFGTGEEIEDGLAINFDLWKNERAHTKVFISPMSSPLDPWIRVPLSQIASVTNRQNHSPRSGKWGDLQADMVILAVGPSSYSILTT